MSKIEVRGCEEEIQSESEEDCDLQTNLFGCDAALWNAD
jgi:hypothetical protein